MFKISCINVLWDGDRPAHASELNKLSLVSETVIGAVTEGPPLRVQHATVQTRGPDGGGTRSHAVQPRSRYGLVIAQQTARHVWVVFLWSLHTRCRLAAMLAQVSQMHLPVTYAAETKTAASRGRSEYLDLAFEIGRGDRI